MNESRKVLVERLFAEHGRALQAFFYRRIRTKADAPDLAQEVYVRMLRVSDVHAIRNPEHYLYTVASNLVKEYAVLDRWRATGVDVDDASLQQRLGELPTLDGQLDVSQRVARLRSTLAHLSPKCRAAVILQYRQGNDRRQFRVAAGDVHVLAVGTRFDSYRRPDATVVTVVEGSVAVLSGRPPLPGAIGFPARATRVNAGYQAHVDTGGVPAQPMAVDVQQAVAWLKRRIAFEQRPLGEVANEFNRYVAIRIEIDDPVLRILPISGVFDAYDVDSFSAFLQTLDGVRVERAATRIRVFSVKSQED